MIVRPASGRAEALAPAVRAAIGRIDKDQLVSVREVRTLEDVAQEATSRYRFRAQLVMAFAVLALLLAMVGRVRRPRVFGAAAHARFRRAPGARRHDG